MGHVKPIHVTMKKLVLITVVLFAVMISAKAQTGTLSVPGAMPSFRWLTDSTVNLGKIEQNKPVTVSFEFVNSGKAPLLISKVEPSCGCTAVDYSKEPVTPGQKGFVKTTYNASAVGVFNKAVTVFSNVADIRKVLNIKGEVVSK